MSQAVDCRSADKCELLLQQGGCVARGAVTSELKALGVIKGLKQRGVNFSLWIEFQNHP